MPDDAPARRPPLHALAVVGVLVAASVVVAVLGVAPARVSATELLGEPRAPGDSAFIASHRGGGATAPENTLAAISAALAAGFEYVEVDVALTADDHAVLIHDATLDRTTDGSGAVRDHTLAEIRALDAGSWFAPEFAGTRVPTFVEFVDLLAGSGRRAIVEIKGHWEEADVAHLVDAVEARGLERSIVLASFDARTLAHAAAASVSIPRMMILRELPPDVVTAVREAGARGIVVDRRALLQRPDTVGRLREAGMRVVVYTLNSDAQWDAVTALGVDGIVTDDPATLSQWQVSNADGG